MNTPLVVPPDLWAEDDRTGSVLLWLCADGAAVRAGDVIAEVLVEKVTLELHAPASGRLHIMVLPDAVVHKGDVIGMIV